MYIYLKRLPVPIDLPFKQISQVSLRSASFMVTSAPRQVKINGFQADKTQIHDAMHLFELVGDVIIHTHIYIYRYVNTYIHS